MVAVDTKAGMHILLADDQRELCLLTAAQLERTGHSVITVADGHAALFELEKSQFDVVLLDEHMPGLGGVEVLHAIRAKPSPKRQIVIALTGYNTDADRLRLLREGFDSVIGKPFRLDQLEAALLASIDTHARMSSAPPSLRGPSADLLQSVGGDQELLLRMIRTFLRDAPKRLAQIETAIRLHRPENLAAAAHALKGSVAIFGASAAQQYCQLLQETGRNRELSRAATTLALLKEEIAKLESNLRGYAGQTGLSAKDVPRKRSRPGSAAKRNHR